LRSLERGRQRLGRVGVAGCVLACLGALIPAVAAGPERKNYIVQFRAEPLASYDGDVSLAATSPKVTGHKVEPASREAVDYRRYLDAIESDVLRVAGVHEATVGYRYRTTLAGFSAQLTAAEVEQIRRQPTVAAVTADRIRSFRPPQPQASDEPAAVGAAAATLAGAAPPMAATASPAASSPETDLGGQPAEFLGLPDGLWARLGGPDHSGEGIVVGVIDSGIYPDHPSFADTPVAPDGTRNYIGPAYDAPPATWHGTCQEGENFPATSCNNKLIGARFFNDGFGPARVADEDFLSPRDSDGHGTGVASIAAGNYGVDPQYLGNDLGLGIISGIAPRARIAAYKAVWVVPAYGGSVGSDSDMAAAIDAAVADGVDVLNLSLGVVIDTLGPFSNPSVLLEPLALGFLRAFDAGVVAVNSAGNAGPEVSIDSPAIAPWIIAAGASGLATTFATTVTVSGGPGGSVFTAPGISPTPGLSDLPIIFGSDAAAPGADPALAERCGRDTLDPTVVKGKVVLCRPQGGAVSTSFNLYLAGAAGGIFFTNTRTFRYNPEEYWLPIVMLTPGDGMAIRDLVRSSPDPTVSFPAGTHTPTTGGDILLRFSSRGPAFVYPSILKPDLVAPGAGIIAANTPDIPVGGFSTEPPGLFRPLFGTSFSSPTTAGAAALLLALHPGLGPSEVMSALMTTANPAVLHDDPGVPSLPTTPHDIGAGRIDPNRAADPGLVVSETTSRFEAFLLTQVPSRDPAQPTVDASDLNRPSIAFDPLIGRRATDRTFTSVDPQPASWQASFTGLTGIEATVEPAQFAIDPGESRTLRFTFQPTDAPGGEYVDGAVVLTNEADGRTVRLPIVLRPAGFAPPERLNFGAPQPAGQAAFPLPTGYDGGLSAIGYGPAAPQTLRNQTVGKDENTGEDDALAQPGPGVTVFDLQVPPGAQALAAETGGPALSDQLSDVDVFLFHDDEGDGFQYDDLVEFSERDGSGEAIIWTDPEPGAYRLSVRGFEADPIAMFDLTTWLIADPSPDVLADISGPGLRITGDPLTALPGGVADLTVEWDGLGEPGVYLGLIRYDVPVTNPDGLPWETVVAITRR
jgi:subtilisin family serine protease